MTAPLRVDDAHDAFGDGGALRAIFHPKTVAVVGAPAEPSTLGHKALAALATSGFDGSLVAVDPQRQDNAFGISVYRKLEDVPAPIDLAVAATASDETLETIEKCAKAGVKGVVVLSGVSAHAEYCRDFAREVRARLRRTPIKLIGPGCCAVMNPSLRLNVSP